MRVNVRYFISPDVDLDRFEPADAGNFSFLLQAIVGPSESEGEESIQFTVCTPRSLERIVNTGEVTFGRSLVIVGHSDIQRILSAVTAAIERVEGASWKDVTYRLALLGVYEFEDYLP